MIISDVVQGSPEWFAERCGIPTCSNFDKLITTKGEPSKSRTKYMYQLAGERITGQREESYQSAAMQRGVELEAEARSFYELMTGETVQIVGLCYADKKKRYACSPDGLIGEHGGIEIKCPQLSTAVEYLLKGVLPTEYYQQVQGSMAVTGRKWWDFVSYYPGMKPLIVRVERNEEFIKALKVELEIFCQELDEITEKLKGE
jgi:predicted phage-related endonuclease